MTEEKLLYRIRFVSQDKVYEIYAKDVYQGDLYGFVVIEEIVFDTNTTVVVDPGEEKLKTEFAGVTQTIIPMHSIVRIDAVEKHGTAKIADLKGNVAQFP
ncbi:MAG: DUF1820 family protein, partial [Granulosicoccus sp.]